MFCVTKHQLMVGLKILIIAGLIMVNMAIFNGSIRFPSDLMAANGVEDVSEEPTATVIPTATVPNYVEDVIQERFEKRSDNVRRVCSAPSSRAASVTKPKVNFRDCFTVQGIECLNECANRKISIRS